MAAQLGSHAQLHLRAESWTHKRLALLTEEGQSSLGKSPSLPRGSPSLHLSSLFSHLPELLFIQPCCVALCTSLHALTLCGPQSPGQERRGDPPADPLTAQHLGRTRLPDRGRQSLSINGRRVNIFGSVGHHLSQLLISARVV